MTGLVRKAMLLCVAGLCVAGAAMAGVPSPANSQTPCVLLMDFVNSLNSPSGVNGAVCNIAALRIIVRDANNAPVAGSTVVIDFSTCGTGGLTGAAGNAQLADTQDDPGVTIICGGRTATKTANGLGEVCFTLVGETNVAGTGPTVSYACGRIYADAQLLDTENVYVNRYDINNDVNVDAADGALHLIAQGADVGGDYRTLGDYDCNNAVDAADGSLHLQAQGNALNGVTVYNGTYCP